MIITRQQGRCRKARSQSTRLRHPPRRRVRQVHAALSTITCRAVQPCSVLTVAAAPSGLSVPPTSACVRLQCIRTSLLLATRTVFIAAAALHPQHSPAAGTVDVGVPQLSMHSIREMCGVDDVRNSPLTTTLFLSIKHRAGAQLQVTRTALSRRFQGA